MYKIALKDLSRWLLLQPGNALEFDRPNYRTVRIEINAEHRTPVSIVRDGGEIQFLANVEGLTLLEFSEAGRFEIIADGPIWAYSAEFERIAFTVPDPVIFTRIAERRSQSPEMQMMMEIMHRNTEKLYAKLDKERAVGEERYARLVAEHQRALAARSDQAVSGPDDGDGQSSEDVGEVEVGSNG